MNVRELIEALQALDPELPVIAEGTEYDLPVDGARESTWHPTDLAGSQAGEEHAVAYLSIGD